MLKLLMLFILSLEICVAKILVEGAGASFPATVYEEWMLLFESTRKPYTDLSLTYRPLGSGYGQNSIKGVGGQKVDYAGSDALLSEKDYTDHPDLVMFPTMAG